MTVLLLGPTERFVWDKTGALIESAKRALGNRDMAWSVILSRITRELRREIGNEEAAKIMRGLADTMSDASNYDLRERP